MRSTNATMHLGRRRCATLRPLPASLVGRVLSLTVLVAVAAGCSSGSGSEDEAGTDRSAPASTEVTGPPDAGGDGDRTVRLMPLGDSLTEGGDPDLPTSSPQSYRGILFNQLDAVGYDIDFVGSKSSPAFEGGDPDHEGHGGFTVGPDDAQLCKECGAANLDAYIEEWLDVARPDVIVLLIGVNDLLPAPTESETGFVRRVDPSEAGDKLVALVGRIRVLAPDADIVVGSYPPISFLVDPALGNVEDFTALNEAAKALGDSGDPNIHYAPIFETLEDSWSDEDVLGTGDDLHPSGEGSRRLSEVFFATLVPVLDARS